MTVNQQHLKQAWDTSQVSTREDWVEWMHRLGVEFMKESPSHALRACMSLVDIHPPLAKELFNAAFLSCWTELYDQYQVRVSGIFGSRYSSRSIRRTLFGPLIMRSRQTTHHRNSYIACSISLNSWNTKKNLCPLNIAPLGNTL